MTASSYAMKLIVVATYSSGNEAKLLLRFKNLLAVMVTELVVPNLRNITELEFLVVAKIPNFRPPPNLF